MVNKKYVGLALSGGGIRGFAHLGAIKALEENGIKPDIISGTSAGALIGAFYASGMTVDEIFHFLKDKDVFALSELALPKKGFLNFKKLEKEMRNKFSAHDFESLQTPLIVTVSNLLDGKVEYHNHGDFINSAIASASIPTLFSPVEIDGNQYCDGGIFNNMPINQLIDKCDILVGVNISPVQPIQDLGSIADIAARAFQLSVNATSIPYLERCDIYIEPQGIRDYDLLDTKHIQEIYDAGYESGMKAIDLNSTILEPPQKTLWQRLFSSF